MLRSLRSIVQAEVFDDELEQASELFRNGYTSAAAVVAGVVLETTIRKICESHDIAHGKLEKMNAELTKAAAYNGLVQKRVTALAAVRNFAAHGKLEEFSNADVEQMINDIRRFVEEHLPA